MSSQNEAAHNQNRSRSCCKRDASKCLTMCPHACIENCPTGAFSLDDNSCILFNQDKCIGCGICVNKCPGGALSIDGKANPHALQTQDCAPQHRVSLKKQILARRKAAKNTQNPS